MRVPCRVCVTLLLLLALALPARALVAVGGYTDLQTHWARDAIETLYDLGALDDPPPLFRPDSPASRGKVARYLTLGWGIEPYRGDREFLTDVPRSHPYHVHVNALYVRRLMVGVGGGRFGVDERVWACFWPWLPAPRTGESSPV